MTKIGFIGAGNMATALISAIVHKDVARDKNIFIYDIDEKKSKRFRKEFSINVMSSNQEVAENSDVVFIAVKPQDIYQVLEDIKEKVTEDKVMVSIAAGVRIASIEDKIGKRKIVRVMPNTPCLVGQMAAGFSVNKNVNKKEIMLVENILGAAGSAFLLKEEMLDAVTGLSGSGPAFVARLIESFAEAGRENGLPEDIAYELSLKTFSGTAELLAEKDMKPGELVRMVSSPGGTTIAGRQILESSDVKEIIKKTVRKATERSKELGK